MDQIQNLSIINLRIDYETNEIKRKEEELDKLKKALEKYGDKKLGKSYDDAYRDWGGPDIRMVAGWEPNEKDYKSKGSYIDIDTLTESTSSKFKDRGPISLNIKILSEMIESNKKILEELISERNRHLESVRETGFDLEGYDLEGYDKDGYNPEGYDRDGYNKEGFDAGGYDRTGYNKDGVNWNGFDKNGIHYITKTEYDTNGRDDEGFTIDGFKYYQGTEVDREGYDRNGWQRVDKENYRL